MGTYFCHKQIMSTTNTPPPPPQPRIPDPDTFILFYFPDELAITRQKNASDT